MGLDMFLRLKEYVGLNQSKEVEPKKIEITVNRYGKTEKIEIDTDKLSEVVYELAYWRKANQIHGWFVKNTSELEPEIRYLVTIQDLEKLLKVLKEVKKSLDKNKILDEKGNITGFKKEGIEFALSKLPPKKGFFYGSYNIDDWYYEDIVESIKMIDEAIKFASEKNENYLEYYASW